MFPLVGFLGMGGMEMIIIFVAVLLLFGPKKLPELARGLGKGIREFKKASNEVTAELERAVEEPPQPPRPKFPPEGSTTEHTVSRSEPTISHPETTTPPEGSTVSAAPDSALTDDHGVPKSDELKVRPQ